MSLAITLFFLVNAGFTIAMNVPVTTPEALREERHFMKADSPFRGGAS